MFFPSAISTIYRRSTGFAPRKFRRLAESARRLRARKSRHGHRDIPEGAAAITRGGILHRRCSTFRIVGQPSGRSSTAWNIRAWLQFAYLTMNIRHPFSSRFRRDTMFLTITERDYLVGWSFSILLYFLSFFTFCCCYIVYWKFYWKEAFIQDAFFFPFLGTWYLSFVSFLRKA